MLASTAAQAVVYTGSKTVGAIHASYSVQTDGTLGVLAENNLLGFSGVLTRNGEARPFASTLSGGLQSLVGTSLIATASQLIFDFGGDGGFAFATISFDGEPVLRAVCFASAAATCPGGESLGTTLIFGLTPEEEFDFAYVAAASEPMVIATAAAAAVPEPASWALLVAGFGLTGAALRRRNAGVLA